MLRTTGKCTIYIRFTHETPRTFVLNDDFGRVYFFRRLDGKTPRIKFNILDAGYFNSTTPFEVVKIVPLEIPKNLPELPPKERERMKPFKVVYNPGLTHSPARVFTQLGVIEKGARFDSFPKMIGDFILWHEIGHFYYETEEYCDLFALVNCLKRGYNRSMCYYALSRILKKTPQNMERLKSLLQNIQKTNSKTLKF
jgi:hypothetical protein